MSTDRELEDFLRRMTPGRVLRERTPTPYTVAAARAYQEQTHLIASALRSGSRVRLEAAVFGDEIRRSA